MRTPVFRYSPRPKALTAVFGNGLDPSGLVVGPITTPTHYQPLDGDLLGYGSANSGTGRLWSAAQNGNTWITGSLSGKQAIHLTTGSPGQYLTSGAPNSPAETNASFTIAMHMKIPAGGFIFPFCIRANGDQSIFEFQAYDDPTGLYLRLKRTSGSPTWDTDRFFFETAMGSEWQDLVVVVDRGANTMKTYRDGVQFGATYSLSFMSTANAWDGYTWSIVGTAGSRVATSSNVYKTASFAEYAYWQGTALTESEVTTLHNLRLRGTSIRTHLGL